MDAAARAMSPRAKCTNARPGCGIPSRLVSREERILRALDISLSESNAAKLRQRPAELPSQVRTQFLTCHEDLSLCVGAAPTKPEDFRPVDTAASVETPNRLSVPPALHRRRPLLREVVLPERLERAHHLAVHQSGPEGIEFAGDRRRGRFVEQRETSRDVALQDEAACLRDPSDGRGSRVVTGARLDGSPGPVSGVLEIAGEQSFVIAHDGEPRMDRRILMMIFEKSVRPREPCPDGGHESHIEQQVHGDTNCGTSCGQVIASLHARSVDPLPRLDRHIEMACCIRSPSQ